MHWIKVTCLESGTFPAVSVAYRVRPCYHCSEPICIEACPVDAIKKRKEDGIVTVDRNLCIGCKECLNACPFGAPQFEESNPDPKMQKCDLCLDRWMEGKKPICVTACPTRALDAGPMDELAEKYGAMLETAGFNYFREAGPSVIFKHKPV
ncbi:MAG: 4Fe-4S dicluster domain-containing protein [Desulfobacterales bacterium]